MGLTGRCATCAHWEAPQEGASHGTCEAVPFDANGCVNHWTSDRETLVAEAATGYEWAIRRLADHDAMRAALAVVHDGSGYAADLSTRPEFGCVLWEARP